MTAMEPARPFISDVPLFLQRKISKLGSSMDSEKWTSLEPDELDLLSTQFLMFGRNFRERLHRAVETRLTAKISPQSLESEWLPDFQKYMPVVIKYNPEDISLDPISLNVCGSLIWHALKNVSQKTGIPLSEQEELDGHPDLDTRMVVSDINGVKYQGESSLGHEVRHCEEMTRLNPKTPAYIVLDYGVSNSSRGPEIGRLGCAFAHGGIKNETEDVYISLAPRFPSGPDIESALKSNPSLAMEILRKKAGYILLTEDLKSYVEDHYVDEQEEIVAILDRAQREFFGLYSFQNIDPSKIAWRKYPWSTSLQRINKQVDIPVPAEIM